YYQPAGGGGSAAAILRYSDRVARVTKFRGNPQNPGQQRQSVLINELVVARLAEALGAAAPPGLVVMVEPVHLQEAQQDVQGLANAEAGPAFGCDWINGQYNPADRLFTLVTNREALASLAILYRWTRNTDFKGEHLLWRMSQEGEIEMFG